MFQKVSFLDLRQPNFRQFGRSRLNLEGLLDLFQTK